MDTGNSQFKKAFSSAGGRLGTNRLLDTGMGKLPPQAVDIEEAVLGALMIEKGTIPRGEGICGHQEYLSQNQTLGYDLHFLHYWLHTFVVAQHSFS